MTKILFKFRQQQLVMVNYVCGFNQSETGKYFQWIIIKFNSAPAHKAYINLACKHALRMGFSEICFRMARGRAREGEPAMVLPLSPAP